MASPHDNIDFPLPDIIKLHDSCFITGTIIEIHKSDNSADVLTSKYQRVNKVKFHYHCDGYSTPEYAYTAFKEEDNVKILCLGARGSTSTPDMKIVGFVEGDLRQCAQPVLLYVYGDPENKLSVSYPPPIPPATDTLMFNDGDLAYCDDWAGTLRKVKNASDSKSGALYGNIDGCFQKVPDEFAPPIMIAGGNVSSNNPATVTECLKRHFKKLYKADEVWSGCSLEKLTIDEEDDIEINSPVEFSASGHSDVICSGTPHNREWHKTYDEMTVAAYISYPEKQPFNEYWAVSATYLGKQVIMPGGESYGGYPTRFMKPDASFQRFYLGFDVWRENDTYYIGVANDDGDLTILEYDKKKNLMKIVESYPTTAKTAYMTLKQEQNSANVGKDLLRLVGYAKRKRWWCDIPTGYDGYWVEEKDKTQLVPNPTEGIGSGAIIDCLFNQVTEEFFLCVYPIKKITSQPPQAYSEFKGAETYYAYPLFCTVSLAGVRSSGCEVKYFLGKAVSINVSSFNVPIIAYYGSDGGGGVTSADNWVFIENVRRTHEFGMVVVSGYNYDQGKVYTVGGSKTGYVNEVQSGSYSFQKIISENGCEIRLVKWMWNATGGFSHQVSRNDYVINDTDFASGYSLNNDNIALSSYGDSAVLGAASPFPHDLGWEAILKHGKDRRENDVAAMVVYNGEAGSNFIMDQYGIKNYSNNHLKNRRFFTTIPLKRKQS